MKMAELSSGMKYTKHSSYPNERTRCGTLNQDRGGRDTYTSDKTLEDDSSQESEIGQALLT